MVEEADTSVKYSNKEPFKPAYDPQLHNEKPAIDSNTNNFGNQGSDMGNKDNNQKKLDNVTGEVLTDKVTVYLKCGKNPSKFVNTIHVQLTKFVKLTNKNDVALNSEDEIFFYFKNGYNSHDARTGNS